MRARLTPAGWVWMAYALALAGLVASCSGCATPAPVAPAAGAVCLVHGELYRLEGPMHGAPTWWAVRHVASDGKAGAWYVSGAELRGCRT